MTIDGWRLISEHPLPAYKATLRRFVHACGAVHHHLASADDHCAFAVAFRTPPTTDTGLPHILEHTTLCGSQRFPVRDPFFKMLRRSLQTFMNAMTYPDFTCYPFASQVAKDFNNLLAVYLDAVFRPILHPLDFAQEGHRLEPKNGAWQRVGVVFNEMKGAMDSTDSQVSAELTKLLMPDTCYRWNYGGEPADIPRLTHQDLVAFHRAHYRPGNAFFSTYGSFDPERLHESLAPYIASEAKAAAIGPPALQKPLAKPQAQTITVPMGEKQQPVDVSSANITWVWGDVAPLDEALMGELIDRLLLGHAGAPLRLALEKSGLGRSVDGSGYQAHYRNGLFTAKLDGIAEADFPRFEPLVTATLNDIAERGLPEKEIEAALHQLELARREITGDSYPYGLELCLRLTGAWNYAADPVETLDQGAAIARLRSHMVKPGYLQKEIRERFFNNPHRAVLFAHGDTAFHRRAEEREKRQVDEEIAGLDEAQKNTMRAQAAALAKRQAQEDDPSVLPDLALSDVPVERRWASSDLKQANLTAFTAGTNGIMHHLVAIRLPQLSHEERQLLPLLMHVLGELGVSKENYAEFSAHLNAVCGGLWTWTDISADIANLGKVNGLLIGEIKGLGSRHAEFTDLLARTLFEQRFDEHDRLTELVEQAVQRMNDRIQSSGNAFARHAASRGFGGAAGYGHELHGLGLLALLKATAAGFANSPSAVAALAGKLNKLLERVRSGQRNLALISDASERAPIIDRIAKAWSSGAAAGAGMEPLLAKREQPTAYTTGSAVNYCALAFPTVAAAHADAPALAVGCRFLTNNFLHPKLREQGGAYGGRAGYSSGNGVVTLSSNRDPRFAETYADMRAGLRWLATIPDDGQLLRESILGVIADIDAPRSPAGEAKARFIADLKGVGPKEWNEFRRCILAVSCADIRRAASTHLDPDGGVAAAVTSEETLAKSKLGWRAVPI